MKETMLMRGSRNVNDYMIKDQDSISNFENF